MVKKRRGGEVHFIHIMGGTPKVHAKGVDIGMVKNRGLLIQSPLLCQYEKDLGTNISSVVY